MLLFVIAIIDTCCPIAYLFFLAHDAREDPSQGPKETAGLRYSSPNVSCSPHISQRKKDKRNIKMKMKTSIAIKGEGEKGKKEKRKKDPDQISHTKDHTDLPVLYVHAKTPMID